MVRYEHDIISNLDGAVNCGHKQTDLIIMDFTRLGVNYFEKVINYIQLVLFDYWILHNRSSKIIGKEVSIDDRL